MSASGDSSDAFFALYRYTPSLEAAAMTGTLFSILSLAHIFKIWQTKSYYFIPFAIGGVFEAVGYFGRIWSHFDQDGIGGYVMQSLLILVAPALFAASVYMILGRTIRAVHAEHHSIIRIQWLTKLFVIGDVVSFLCQGGGGGIQAAGTLKLYELGEKIILVGLFVQIIMFGIFIASALVFHRRVLLSPTTESRDGSVRWKSHMWALYLVSGLVMVRSVFRVVEYAQGNRGYLVRREYFLYLFDAVLMLVTMGTFLVQYVDDLNPISRKFSTVEMEDLEH
ncbi:RTA1 like protein-domain-containing protein [Xylariaceae sp. FL0016]|nr:RTA1 like protein-domain-containing protein [Xylariaceae sp. FL0016]